MLPQSVLNRWLRTKELYRVASTRRLFSTLTVTNNFITGVGHGRKDTYAGQNKEVLWKVDQYRPSEVQDKMIKLLSCEVGAVLGPDIIENGARAFQGYDETFSFFVDAKHALIPWLDPVGSRFLMPVIQGVQALLKGKTNQEAYQIEYDWHTKNMEAEVDPELRDWIKHNRDALVMLGDADAKLQSSFILGF